MDRLFSRDLSNVDLSQKKEFFMKNTVKLFGIIAMVAVIGFAMSACDTGGDDWSGDKALNGTWASDDDPTETIKFSSGNFEMLTSGVAFFKGTYTTSNGSITEKLTSIYGLALIGMTGGLSVNVSPTKWYSVNEVKNLFKDVPFADEFINEMSAPQTSTYSISGTKLTLAGDTFTKK
jgi:hypothetical protein